MAIQYIRGWVGLGIFLVGIGMIFFEQTKPYSWIAIGFGMGMMSSGFA
jgi:hypothetical protein